MIHIDGFEEFRGEQALSEALTRSDYTVTGTDWTLIAGRGTTFGAAAVAAGSAKLTRVMPWTTPKFTVGIAHYFNSRGAVATVKLGANSYTLWMNPQTGLPYVNGIAGGALPTITRWYYYELEVDRAAGTMTLYINNKFDSVYALEGSLAAITAATVTLGWRDPSEYRPQLPGGGYPTDTGVKAYDDFYMRDGARLGPIMVTTRTPSNDKHVEWFQAATSGSHSFSLSLQPPQPLDNYVASDTIGKEERFQSGTPLANANPVVASGLLVMARKAPTLSAKLGVFIGGQAGAPLRQDTRIVGSEWRTQYVCFEQVEGDTVAGVTTADFGFNVSSN